MFTERRYKPAERWLDGAGTPFAPGVHYVVGGNTKVYGASLPRLREQDFGALEHREGTSPAWPFDYAALEPYYGEAEAIYRVHGTTGEDPTEPWRSTPFPYPALAHEPYIADLARRLRAPGVHAVGQRDGRRSAPGRPVRALCHLRRLPVPARGQERRRDVRVEPALRTGNARLETGIRVRRIATDAIGRCVTHLLAEGPDGPVRVTGGRFVLSAGAVNSAALLLASADEKHPRGLANGSDQVGRNFMMHNNAHVVAVDLDRRNDVIFQKTLSVNDWYLDGGDGYPLGAMQLIGKVQGAMMALEAPRVPRVLLDQVAARSVAWLVMAEDLPHPDNRVIVDSAGRITTVRSALGAATHRALHKRAKQLLRGAGYDAVLTQWFDISMNSHQCGTVRAGHDPATSVLDPWCKAHELENLWVIDGGFFPSSGAMNPALTIAAQALRVVAESDLAG